MISWDSDDQEGNGDGIYAQRFNAAGVAQGSEFHVNTYTSGDQLFPIVGMDATGDFVIVWTSQYQDSGSTGVYGQRFNAAGIAQGTEFQVNTFTTGNQLNPYVAMDAAGDFVATWASNGQDQDSFGIYAQRFNADGTHDGGEFLVNSYTTGSQSGSVTAFDAQGDFTIAWQSSSQDGGGYGIYAAMWCRTRSDFPEFRVNTYTTLHDQTQASVASDGRETSSLPEKVVMRMALATAFSLSDIMPLACRRGANSRSIRIPRAHSRFLKWPWMRPATLSSPGQANTKTAAATAFLPDDTIQRACRKGASSASIRIPAEIRSYRP